MKGENGFDNDSDAIGARREESDRLEKVDTHTLTVGRLGRNNDRYVTFIILASLDALVASWPVSSHVIRDAHTSFSVCK
jgi:hypothetical protein